MSTNKSHSKEILKKAVARGRDSFHAIIKSTSILSLGTLSSRILGFGRDVILAGLIGTGMRADAFFVALKVPNLFRDLVGEGATNAAIVPVLSEYAQKEDKEKFWGFVSVVLSLGLIALSVVTILGITFAPVLVTTIAPGFSASPENLALTIRLTRLMFPYLVFIGLTAYCTGILFTFRSFKVPAFSPCLFNIAIIASALIASQRMEEPVFGLAIGVLIGGVLQLLVQIQPLRKIGMRYQRPKTLIHPGAKKIGKLLIPRMIGSGVYQLTVLIDTFCASLSMIVGPGGISAIYYSNRIIQLPMGIFSVALASAVLPTFSDFAAKKDTASLKKTLAFTLENIFFVMCPFMALILVLAYPIIRILFQRGEFNSYSTHITSTALFFYAFGLFSFGGIKILVTAFYALQDTKTPVKVAFGCLILNAILNFILMHPFQVGGIALASAIAGTVDFLVLFYIMEKKIGCLEKNLLGYCGKVVAVSVLMGGIVFLSWRYIVAPDVIKLFIVIIAGLVFYQWICFIWRIEQARKLWHYARNIKNDSSN